MQRVSSLEHKPVKMHEMSINPRGRLSCLTNKSRFFRNVFFSSRRFCMKNRVKWTGTLLICLNCSENKWWKGLNVADGQMHTLSHLIIRNSLPELITSLLIKKINKYIHACDFYCSEWNTWLMLSKFLNKNFECLFDLSL